MLFSEQSFVHQTTKDLPLISSPTIHVHPVTMSAARMPTIAVSRRAMESIRTSAVKRVASRQLSSSSRSPTTQPGPSTDNASPAPSSSQGYYKITLLRSAISLGDRKKGTLMSLGIHRRMQTVYHPHSPEFAGKILAVKELVKVENVGRDAVRTKTERSRERRPVRGFEVVGGLDDRNLERICELGLPNKYYLVIVNWKLLGVMPCQVTHKVAYFVNVAKALARCSVCLAHLLAAGSLGTTEPLLRTGPRLLLGHSHSDRQ